MIKPHFPLDPFMYQWLGVEKTVLYDSIVKFESKKAFLFKTGIFLTYRKEDGKEEKIVFTVKLAPSLIQQVKETAKTSGYSISDFTAKALARFLRDGFDYG